MTVDACSLHFLFYWFDKSSDICIARSFRFIQLLTDHVIRIVLHVFQRQILQLALQFIETEFMGQRCIKIGRFLRYLHLSLQILRIANLAHQVHTVGNHDEDHAHILCKRQEQVSKVLTLNHRILQIELLDTIQAVQDACHLWAMFCLNGLNGRVSCLDLGDEIHGFDSLALQSDFLFQDLCRLGRHALLFFVCKSKQICHSVQNLRQRYNFL